jgi:dephospho-CoA kinase
MKAYGLTGGIGMGKSLSEKILRERGIKVVDTDAIAREIVEPGQPALEEIKALFGQSVMDGQGRLRRDELARKVFGDDHARKQLEDILHPRIRTIWRKQLADWRADGIERAVVVIPLLYETDGAPEFDAVICVACSAETQRERLRGRGWDDEQISRRLQAQWPVEKKMELANFVVWTEGEVESHRQQLERIFA